VSELVALLKAKRGAQIDFVLVRKIRAAEKSVKAARRAPKKIEADAAQPRYLVTVSGVGYALRADGADVE